MHRVGGAEAGEVGGAGDGGEPRALAFDEGEVGAEGVRDEEDVGEEDGGVEAVAADRLQRDLGGELGGVAEVEEAARRGRGRRGTPAGSGRPGASSRPAAPAAPRRRGRASSASSSARTGPLPRLAATGRDLTDRARKGKPVPPDLPDPDAPAPHRHPRQPAGAGAGARGARPADGGARAAGGGLRARGDPHHRRPGAGPARCATLGGKGLFTREIEEALAAGAIDIAVHSMKDMPTLQPDGARDLGAAAARGSARRLRLARRPRRWRRSRPGASSARSSLRRRAQVLHRRPDLAVVEFRGSVQTRLRKLEEGVAAATLPRRWPGCARLGIAGDGAADRARRRCCRPSPRARSASSSAAADARVAALLAPIHTRETGLRLAAERAFLAGARRLVPDADRRARRARRRAAALSRRDPAPRRLGGLRARGSTRRRRRTAAALRRRGGGGAARAGGAGVLRRLSDTG